ncbi:hypothetical protein [Bacillus massilinigeriensis]|uniref:hypothetical protein n=1 Tax=Bacillus massilionigeriensis TaxID=1805475 RepID=UPI00096B36D1|nr:hypothetical protein [Bacillus massilionigeriensis]
MGICPVCNGFEHIDKTCPSCGNQLEDSGRIMDFYDDYSPYMPIDQMKLEDGYPNDFSNKECPHFLTCASCGYSSVLLIKE